MAKEFNIAKVTGTCCACDKQLEPGSEVVATVWEVGEEFERRDYCPPCWESFSANPPAADPAAEPAADAPAPNPSADGEADPVAQASRPCPESEQGSTGEEASPSPQEPASEGHGQDARGTHGQDALATEDHQTPPPCPPSDAPETPQDVEPPPTESAEGAAVRARPAPGLFPFGVWRTAVPVPTEKKRLFVDDELLVNFFDRLEDAAEPAKINFRFVLALILMRKRLLTYERARKRDDGVEVWTLRLRGDDRRREVLNPEMDEDQTAQVSEQLSTILQGEL